MLNVPVDQLQYLGFYFDVPGVGRFECAWNARTKVLAIEGVENAAKAALLVGRMVGEGIAIGGQMTAAAGATSVAVTSPAPVPPPAAIQTPPAPPLPAPAAPPPQQPQLSLVPPQQSAAQAQPQQQAPAQPMQPQQPNPPLPEDAVFARASRVGEVIEELIKRGAKNEDEILAGAKALMARNAAPVLTGVEDDDLRMMSHGPLLMAGLG